MSEPFYARVLVDRHQADLLYSLQLLFEDRLGFELYVPVGMEWWDEGYWQFGIQAYADDRLARQFLAIDAAYRREDESTMRLGHYVTFDHHHPERKLWAATLDDVRATRDEWEFVVATVQDNQQGFHRLAGELGARYLLQVGNTGQQIDWGLDPLALVSSEMPIEGRGVRYHQEFDSAGTFGFRDPAGIDRRRISSFVNCMPQTRCWPLLEEYRAALRDHRFSIHGIGGEDGNIPGVAPIAAVMSQSGWGWHDKEQGDGFGHIIHNWAAVGRPLIGHASHYAGRLAEPFWEDLVTCVDLDRRSVSENVALIREISADPVWHSRMCRTIRGRFDELVDFDREAEQIRELLGS